MDPVSIIVAALSAGAAAGLKPTAENVVKDAYEGIKSLIARKYGEKKDLQEAIQKLEEKPESSARKEFVREEIAESGAPDDQEVVAAANALIEKLQARPGGQQIIQSVTGDRNVFSGSGDVTVRTSDKSD